MTIRTISAVLNDFLRRVQGYSESDSNDYLSRLKSIVTDISTTVRTVTSHTELIALGVISTINGGSDIVNNRISVSEMNYGTMYNAHAAVGHSSVCLSAESLSCLLRIIDLLLYSQ